MHGLSRPGYPQVSLKPGHSLMAAISWPREAFIPRRTPYLGQTDIGEPKRRCNVLSPDRRLQ